MRASRRGQAIRFTPIMLANAEKNSSRCCEALSQHLFGIALFLVRCETLSQHLMWGFCCETLSQQKKETYGFGQFLAHFSPSNCVWGYDFAKFEISKMQGFRCKAKSLAIEMIE